RRRTAWAGDVRGGLDSRPATGELYAVAARVAPVAPGSPHCRARRGKHHRAREHDAARRIGEGRGMSIVLRTSELGKRYGERWALRNCTLDLEAGEIVALVGPNGAGKTTLLHLAVGLLAPTTGEVEVFGTNPRESVDALGRIGFVAQETPLYGGFRVGEMVTFGRRL